MRLSAISSSYDFVLGRRSVKVFAGGIRVHVLARAAMALNLVMFLILPASASAHSHWKHTVKRQPLAVAQLYSSRARRRVAMILQLKLLELHEAHLDRLREVILRKLPVDDLLKAEKPPE